MDAIYQNIPVLNPEISLCIKREDLLHPTIPGNKIRKLKYNLIEAKRQNKTTLLTFGGAYSNHIAAVAQAGSEYGFNTIGIVRGEELEGKIDQNPTLANAQKLGMKLLFVTREQYRNKEDADFISRLESTFGSFYLLPEGGTNELAVLGCEEILTMQDELFDYICCAVGTGGTMCGLINSALKNQQILGFPAVRDNYDVTIKRYSKGENWKLVSDYDFGGYGKVNEELIHFMNDFYKKSKIPLDPVYNAKMVFGVIDLINKNYFDPGSRILLIHTGGLQGIQGMNLMLRSKNLPIIEFDD